MEKADFDRIAKLLEDGFAMMHRRFDQLDERFKGLTDNMREVKSDLKEVKDITQSTNDRIRAWAAENPLRTLN